MVRASRGESADNPVGTPTKEHHPMSSTLTPGASRPSNNATAFAGRKVAAAELRLQIQIGDMADLLAILTDQSHGLLTENGTADLAAYRARIKALETMNGDILASIERLRDLLDVGADILLVTVGRSVCDTLARILESANAHVTALDDGA